MGKKVKKTKAVDGKIVKQEAKGASGQDKFNEILQKSDSAIIITATKGNIEVTGIKNVNYAYQAKGMIHGALDSYLLVPISSTLNSVNQINVKMHHNTINEVKKMLGIKDKPVVTLNDGDKPVENKLNEETSKATKE